MKNFPQLLKTTQRSIRFHAVIWLVASLGLSFSTAAFWMIKEQLSTQRQVEFSWVAHNRNRLIKHGVEGALEPIRMTRDYVQALGTVTNDQFRSVTVPLLHRHSGIEMLGLISPVQNAADVPHPSNGITIEDESAAYATLTHVEALGRTRFSHGYKIASQPVLADAMRRARQTDAMAVSERIEIVSQDSPKYGVMACLPLYKFANDAAKVEQQSKQIVGFVVAILKLDELTHVAVSYLEPRGVDLLILDESAKEGAHFLEFYASRLKPSTEIREEHAQQWLATAELKSTETIQMADRQWSITAAPNANFRSAEGFEKGAWVVLVGGILLTVLLCVYLLRTKLSMQERLKMSQQLKGREELFWQMTETVDDVFWAITADRSQFLYVSPAFESKWGFSCEAVYKNTQRYFDTIHPDDTTHWFDALEQAKRQATPTEVLYRMIRLDGTLRWIRDSIFPIRNAMGEVYRLVGVAEDVHEKKQADDALRDSEKKLRTLFNQSPDTIMTVDKSGKILLMHRGATAESSGRRAMGQYLDSSQLLPPAYREDYWLLLARAFQDGEVSYLPYQSEDATWWEIRVVPIFENDQVIAAMVISTDITEKRNLQAQAIRNARLASIGVLATGVAHDINNPNNAIQTGAALFSHVWKDAMPILREYYGEHGDFSLGGLSFVEEGEALVGLVSEIKDNSRRIEAIVKNLKHLGKNNQDDLNEEVDINTALRSAAGVIGSSIRKYTHNWAMELAEDLPTVRGNLQQLEQVFINLMLNALQSLPDKARGVRITSALDPSKETLLIRVKDEGSGIPEENLSRVTEPFFTTHLETGGTGLGLSISSTIIENHQGTITFESTKGVGTLVTITLPVGNQLVLST